MMRSVEDWARYRGKGPKPLWGRDWKNQRTSQGQLPQKSRCVHGGACVEKIKYIEAFTDRSIVGACLSSQPLAEGSKVQDQFMLHIEILPQSKKTD